MLYSKRRQIDEFLAVGKEGISDEMKIIRDGKIQALQARFNLHHSHSENLVVTLTGPDGTAVKLHNKEKVKGKILCVQVGGKALKKFVGGKAKGNWKISVKDGSKKDSGILNDWCLIFDFAQPKTSEVILDQKAKATISSKHYCHTAGKVSSAKASVNIAHANIGDLKVALVSPGGKEVVLHNKADKGKKNLKKKFKKSDLEKLNGEKSKGIWTLSITDFKGKFGGQLKSWKLDLDSE